MVCFTELFLSHLKMQALILLFHKPSLSDTVHVVAEFTGFY